MTVPLVLSTPALTVASICASVQTGMLTTPKACLQVAVGDRFNPSFLHACCSPVDDGAEKSRQSTLGAGSFRTEGFLEYYVCLGQTSPLRATQSCPSLQHSNRRLRRSALYILTVVDQSGRALSPAVFFHHRARDSKEPPGTVAVADTTLHGAVCAARYP